MMQKREKSIGNREQEYDNQKAIEIKKIKSIHMKGGQNQRKINQKLINQGKHRQKYL